MFYPGNISLVRPTRSSGDMTGYTFFFHSGVIFRCLSTMKFEAYRERLFGSGEVVHLTQKGEQHVNVFTLPFLQQWIDLSVFDHHEACEGSRKVFEPNFLRLVISMKFQVWAR